MRSKSDKSRAILAVPMALWMTAFVGVTLLYIIGLSFMATDENNALTGAFTLDSYRELFQPRYLRVLLLSMELALKTTLITLLIGYPFGYCMARVTPKWRSVIMLLVIVPFWTNALIRLYGWRILLNASGPINAALRALRLTDAPLKLLGTQGAVILGMVYALIPFMILPVYTSVERMDPALLDAARDLGASRAYAFITVTARVTLPGVLAGCVLTFIPSIGLFYISDLLGGGAVVLMGNLVQDALLKSRNLPFAAALSVLMLAMTAVVIALYRRAGGSNDMLVF